MTVANCLTLLPNPVTLLLGSGGTELTDSRRFVDLVGCEAARCQFGATVAASVRVEYSTDLGATWAVLVSEDDYVGTNPYLSSWAVLPETAMNDVMVRAVGSGGLLTTVKYVELEFR